MMGRALSMSVHGVEVHRYRAVCPPGALPALSSGTKGAYCSRPVMCGAVAGLWL